MYLDGEDKPYLHIILKWLLANNDNETDLTAPYIKPSLRHVYPLCIILHACVCLTGAVGNVTLVSSIVRRRLHTHPPYLYIINLALNDIFQAVIVLPMTVANLLLQNWVFGSFVCFVLPMMNSLPVHVAMLTHALIAVDRYRRILRPMAARLPAGLCLLAVWVVALCVVLPQAVFIKYIDLAATLDDNRFVGAAICCVNVERHIEQYIRAMFVVMYCLPLAVIAFLYVKVSTELKIVDYLSSDTINLDNSSISGLSGEVTRSCSLEGHKNAETSRTSGESTYIGTFNSSRRMSEYADDIDARAEKRTQRYLVVMVTVFAVCWCPLNILILVTHFVYETDKNSRDFDITYLIFTFFGYISTCTNPVLFASLRMSERTKDRLRGYFRFNDRRRSGGSKCSAMVRSDIASRDT